jgi:hypothetical protein
MEGQEEE